MLEPLSLLTNVWINIAIIGMSEVFKDRHHKIILLVKFKTLDFRKVSVEWLLAGLGQC
jgi:hypothetical protein